MNITYLIRSISVIMRSTPKDSVVLNFLVLCGRLPRDFKKLIRVSNFSKSQGLQATHYKR